MELQGEILWYCCFAIRAVWLRFCISISLCDRKSHTNWLEKEVCQISINSLRYEFMKKNDKKSRILHSVYCIPVAIHDNRKDERLKLPPVVKFYSTRRRSISDVNDDSKPGAELLGNRGQWPEIDGSLVGLQNGPETRNIVLERCFSKNFAIGAIPEQNRRDASSRIKLSRLIQCLWTR